MIHKRGPQIITIVSLRENFEKNKADVESFCTILGVKQKKKIKHKKSKSGKVYSSILFVHYNIMSRVSKGI